MELHSLRPASGAKKRKKRIARGQGSGHGGTATRGHKGAKSRSGYKEKRNFEGGQMPLQMRLPKVGFKNPNRKVYRPFNVERLQEIADKYQTDTIDVEFLRENRLIRRNDIVKVLGQGELTSKLTVSVHKCSKSAKASIEKAGGNVTELEQPND